MVDSHTPKTYRPYILLTQLMDSPDSRDILHLCLFVCLLFLFLFCFSVFSFINYFVCLLILMLSGLQLHLLIPYSVMWLAPYKMSILGLTTLGSGLGHLAR